MAKFIYYCCVLVHSFGGSGNGSTAVAVVSLVVVDALLCYFSHCARSQVKCRLFIRIFSTELNFILYVQFFCFCFSLFISIAFSAPHTHTHLPCVVAVVHGHVVAVVVVVDLSIVFVADVADKKI